MKKIHRYAQLIMGILAMMLMLTACGEVRETPELVEPLSDNQSFRPVERRTIGTMKVEIGYVVPEEYSHFYKRATTIKDINCTLGQYVNEGDVLAVADIENLQDQLEEMQAAYNLLVAEHEVRLPEYELNIKILNSRRQASLYMYDEESAKDINTEIKKEEENHTYDEELYSYMVDYYQREIADLQKDIKDATLKAKKSGYVTYIKDTSKGSMVGINEAVVVIADDSNVHIEVDGVTTGNNPYKKYEVKYALINGEEVAVEEMEYTSQETVLSKVQESYPNIRYVPTKQTDLKTGDTVVMCFIVTEKRDVLSIGYDSSNADEGGSYVYVKGANDELEKRYVELGIGDDYYVEVISGLEEGEEVYYVQESIKPIYYEEYVVEKSDYVQTVEGKSIKKADIINTAYFTKCNGKVDKIVVNSGESFSKGDVLMVIDSGGGSAVIQEVENDIKHARMDYEKSVKEYDKQISDLKTQNLRLLTSIEEGRFYDTLGEHEEDAIECQRDILLHQASIAEIQKEVLRLEYEDNVRKLQKRVEKLRKNNNGSGMINVIAEDDGVVSRVYVIEGNVVEVGGENSLLMSCTKASDDMASIAIGKDVTIPGISAKVTISVKDKDYKYSAQIASRNIPKSYAFTEDDKAYVSACLNTNSGTPAFVAHLDDAEFFDKEVIKDCKAEIEQLNLPNMIVVPGSVVYYEDSKTKDAKKYFVWKVENGQLVKQYVIKGTSYNIGNDMRTVILSGVSEGDILAKEANANTATNNK